VAIGRTVLVVLLIVFFGIGVVTLASYTSTNGNSSSSGSTTTTTRISTSSYLIGGGQIQHVVLIVLEDRQYPGGSNPQYEEPVPYTFQRDAPFLYGLISKYAFAGNFQSVSYPSLGAYMILTGGTQCYPASPADGNVAHCLNTDPYPENDAAPNDTRLAPGLQTEDVQPSSVESIASLFDQKGLTWRAFAEDMPYPCYAYDYHSNSAQPGAEYSVNHNPFVYYETVYGNGPYPTTNVYPATVGSDGGDAYCQQHVLPFASTTSWTGETLSSDLMNNGANMPNFAFISPDEIHGGGDYGNMTSIDEWSQAFLSPLLDNVAFMSHTVIFVTFDDAGGPCCGELYTIALGPSSIVKSDYTSSASYNHYSLIATIEDIFGLGNLGRDDATATPMSDLFVTASGSSTAIDGYSTGTGATGAAGVLVGSLPSSKSPNDAIAIVSQIYSCTSGEPRKLSTS